MQESYREKRVTERISANEEVNISYRNMFYSGTVLNLSEKGMFIGTKKYFPPDSMCVITFREKNDFMKLFAKVKQRTSLNTFYNGIGVELLGPPQTYLQFIDTLRP